MKDNRMTASMIRRRYLAGLLILIWGVLLFASAFEAKSARRSGRSGTVKVAVVDRTYKAAARTIRFLHACGFRTVWVHTKHINPKKYDGLVIPGGGDVDPRLYGAKKRHSTVYGTDVARSRLQIAAILKFAEAGKPVLGICGGEQTINVAFGGTLKQHIGWHTGWRNVRISRSSWLRGTFGAGQSVFHFHHQSVGKLGKGLKATMWASDNGIIEGIEHTSLPIYGIQWHPEDMGGMGRKVGERFRAVCRKYR